MAPWSAALRARAAGHRLLRGERAVRLGALILLAIFSLWQMPHSYAIAIFRFKDYQAANIPVLPVVKGILVAKHHITLYILAFMVPTLMLFLGGYAGYKYLVVATAVSVWWLGMALSGYKAAVDDSPGRASCSCSPSSPLLA